MANIPVTDVSRWLHAHRPAVDSALLRVVASGRFLQGPEVSAFEAEFAGYCGTAHCVAVGNGTDALEIAIRALACGPGDQVITVANAGMYASCAVAAAGARPVPVDVDPTTMTIDLAALAAAIGPRTKAVVATHLYGRLVDMAGLLAITDRRRLPVIEDCAQAHGASRDGRKAGAWGALGCFSFYPTKNLGALGDGGALTTDDSELAARVRALSQYGWTRRYHAALPGGRNSRLDELQAAVLRLKLPLLDGFNARRRTIVEAYRQALAGLPAALPPADRPDTAAHLCVMVTEDREAVRERLQAFGIDSAIHYPVPDHRQPALAGLVDEGCSLPVTDWLTPRILSLPCFPEMTDGEIERVAYALRQAVAG
jgi:dTDP-3-amino-2,3,6-trideoxy-4-keto-D-glucose/dTDP-3-amino-3,4,6-trideoxy-alpha-D-glucose/dTDP-2,6-dideoxy-D-kanosamine transaminase